VIDHFTAHRLRFVTEVQSIIELNEHQGSAIRGSLFHALRGQFCTYRQASECAACTLVATRPVATLVSMLKPGDRRGRDVPRPYTVQPPLPGRSGGPAGGAGCGQAEAEVDTRDLKDLRAAGVPVWYDGERSRAMMAAASCGYG